VLELQGDLPIFVGMKLDGGLRRQLEGLTGPNRQYVSDDASSFLRLCRVGDEIYVGKLVYERLDSQRVDDIRRNVLSILARLCPDVRLPTHFEILAAARDESALPGERETR
jgi:hypothetical protein